MKVYAVIYDWAIDGDCGVSILGIFKDRTKAVEKMDEQAKKIKEQHSVEHLDQEDSVPGDYFDLYQDGYYSQEHEHIAIEEHQTQ